MSDFSQLSIVLRYFDCRSRGQALRFALTDAGVPFRDERIPVEELEVFRRDAGSPEIGGPFASLPLLRWGDTTIAQTLAVAVYVADKLWPGATPEERAFDAMISSAAHLDMQVPFSPLLWMDASSPDERIRARADQLLGMLAARTGQLEQLLSAQATDGPFFGGSEPRMGDYFVYESLSRACDVFGRAYLEKLVAAPQLERLKNRMEQRPPIRALLESGAVPVRITASPSELRLRERLR